jgi:Protein of unknown function (DUF2934)
MVEKRVSAVRKTVRRQAKPSAELSDRAAMEVLESAIADTYSDPTLRRQWIATEAYFRAERRGFEAGHELEDWTAAEAAVASRLERLLVA